MKRFLMLASVVVLSAALLPILANARETPRPETGPVPGIPGLVPGRIVYYTPTPNDPFKMTDSKPIVGIITRVWDADSGMINIRLFCDGAGEFPGFYDDNGTPMMELVTSRVHDPEGTPGNLAIPSVESGTQ